MTKNSNQPGALDFLQFSNLQLVAQDFVYDLDSGQMTGGNIRLSGASVGLADIATLLDFEIVFDRATETTSFAAANLEADLGGVTLTAVDPVIDYRFEGNLQNGGSGGPGLSGVLLDTPGVNDALYAPGAVGQALDLRENPVSQASGGDGVSPTTRRTTSSARCSQ